MGTTKNRATIFRAFILAGIVAAILGASIDFLVPGIVPAELARAYATVSTIEDATLQTLAVLGVFAFVFLSCGVAAIIGLFRFKRWGRRLALWITVLSLLMYPTLGPVVYSGWALMLTETSIMLWGAVLAMAYFSELKTRFVQ